MASIIKAGRGIRAKEQTHVILMIDVEYESYLNEVRALSKKDQKKWKKHNEKTDGSTSTIRFDGKNLYTQWLNSHVDVVSQSMMTDIQKEREGQSQLVTKIQLEDYQNTENVHAYMDQMLIETHTGKHTSRNHPIRVPTSAGEPVRA